MESTKRKMKYKDSIRWILIVQAIFFILAMLFPDAFFGIFLIIAGLVAFIFAVISLVIKE